MSYDTRIDDLALFFEDQAKWITYQDYAYKAPEVSDPPGHWKNAIFCQEEVDGKTFYVVNLSLLDLPGWANQDHPERWVEQVKAQRKRDKAEAEAKDKTEETASPPKVDRADLGDGDLVVIPWDAEGMEARVVRRQDYKSLTDVLDTKGGPDLHFLSQTEGAVVANVPKADLVGMSCFVLNLRALRSRR